MKIINRPIPAGVSRIPLLPGRLVGISIDTNNLMANTAYFVDGVGNKARIYIGSSMYGSTQYSPIPVTITEGNPIDLEIQVSGPNTVLLAYDE